MAFIERCKKAAKAVKQAALDLTDLEMWVLPPAPEPATPAPPPARAKVGDRVPPPSTWRLTS